MGGLWFRVEGRGEGILWSASCQGICASHDIGHSEFQCAEQVHPSTSLMMDESIMGPAFPYRNTSPPKAFPCLGLFRVDQG